MKAQNIFITAVLILLTINGLFAQQFLNETLTYDGETREYRIYIPASYDGSSSFPLLFNFHGGNGDIDSQVYTSDMRPIADTANVIIVYPQALEDPGDGGSTNWLHKYPTEVDDVFFVEAMIETIAEQYTINESRVYACGYSLGGEFTYELACRLNDKIAAIGAVARTMGTAAFDNCAPVHPTGILTILGTDDEVSPYEGLEWAGTQYYLSADDMHNYWAVQNNCETNATVSNIPNTNSSDGSTVERHTWSTASACAYVEELKVIGGGHDWPGTFGNMDIDASLEIWNFVSRYNLEGLIDCGTTAINEPNAPQETSIYPNPATNSITIDRDFSKKQSFQIYSTTGKLMLRGEIGGTNKTIDLSDIPSNVYFLRIGNEVWKFVSEK